MNDTICKWFCESGAWHALEPWIQIQTCVRVYHDSSGCR